MIAFLFISSSIRFASCSESSKLVFGQVGDTVTLPCKYDITTNGQLSVCWGRHQSWFSCENTVISTDGWRVIYKESLRFSLASGLKQGDVSLTIREVQMWDTGMYVCRIEIPGPFNDISYYVYLFISSGLDPKRVVSETQEAPTKATQRKQVFLTTKPVKGTTADAVDIHMGEVIAANHHEKTMEDFVIKTIKAGAIIFIPGLIIGFLYRLRRSRE
ncbi:hypothetical protein DNTS_027806 [Danionella cerebrum]|uniref:Ig-like domain-containing protein n=1 Tax=Danionella cerebrum TaxID=2873325 RepID=A0A553RNQ7_9TELE|nr:hypothetical protein DNTS_027806 [Danionella translucida]